MVYNCSECRMTVW